MSVVTKVFVVLVTILSVILVALIVPFVANTENYRQQAQDAEAAKLLAQETAELRQSQLADVQQKDSQRVTALKSESTNLLSQINHLSKNIQDRDSELNAARAKNASYEANLSRLASANQQHVQIISEYEAELKERREQVLKQQTQIIQLINRNKELDSQLDALGRQVRRVSEKMTQLEERNSELEIKLSQLPPEWQAKLLSEETPVGPIVSKIPIKGKVTGVERFDDETYAQVNVGKNDGVIENMKFLVHRGSQFIGSLIITTVDARSAAGRLELLQGEVATGDAVLTGGY